MLNLGATAAQKLYDLPFTTTCTGYLPYGVASPFDYGCKNNFPTEARTCPNPPIESGAHAFRSVVIATEGRAPMRCEVPFWCRCRDSCLRGTGFAVPRAPNGGYYGSPYDIDFNAAAKAAGQ